MDSNQNEERNLYYSYEMAETMSLAVERDSRRYFTDLSFEKEDAK